MFSNSALSLPDPVSHALRPHMQRRNWDKGATVHSPASPSQRFYLIEEGQIRFNLLTEEGDEGEVFILGPGRCFGEIGVLTGLSPGLFAVCDKPSVTLSINNQGLKQVMDDTPFVRDWLLALLARRLYFAHSMLALSRSSNATEIVWRYINWLRQNGLVQIDQDGIVSLPMTQQALAERVGLSRSSVAAAIAQLKKQGKVDTQYRRLCFVD